MKSLLYTKTGDSGTTSLVDGSRARKDCNRIEAYGDVDELSSSLGLLAADKDCPEEIKGQLRSIQNELFNIGSYLATPVKAGEQPTLPTLGEATLKTEQWIDLLDEQTPKIRSFVLPGGSRAASLAHVARTVCRRAERRIWTLDGESFVDPQVMAYVNRLSDYLFICARYLNFLTGVEEVVWNPSTR